MNHELEVLELQDLHELLINKNKEFTNAMKMGKKHRELVPIYESIKAVYSAIVSRRKTYQGSAVS